MVSVVKYQSRPKFKPLQLLTKLFRPSRQGRIKSWDRIDNLKSWCQLSWRVSTVETNQDPDQGYPYCRDILLKTVKIILTVKTCFYFFSVEIFEIETFQLRLSCVKILVICWDFLRFINIIAAFWGSSGSKILTNLEISIEKCAKIVTLKIKMQLNMKKG